MLNEKLEKAEKALKEVGEIQRNIQTLINERKSKFENIGINDAIKALTELIILERVLDTFSYAIELDADERGISILEASSLKSEIPSSSEIFEILSQKYRKDISDDCQITMQFIDNILFQNITGKIFNIKGGTEHE